MRERWVEQPTFQDGILFFCYPIRFLCWDEIPDKKIAKLLCALPAMWFSDENYIFVLNGPTMFVWYVVSCQKDEIPQQNRSIYMYLQYNYENRRIVQNQQNHVFPSKDRTISDIPSCVHALLCSISNACLILFSPLPTFYNQVRPWPECKIHCAFR